MPGFDKTGPMGNGPMTGRRMGKCTNFGAKQKAKMLSEEQNQNTSSEEITNEQVSGFGHGRGFGFGRGRGGFGCGMGRRNRFRGVF
ncbi:MAG: DUF5320 domain-containing protein [Bacteroidales bacterium]